METNFQDALADLAKRYDLTALYVFGSQAAEAALIIQSPFIPTLNPEVDLDIGIQPLSARTLSAQDRVEITLALEELFKIRRVDLVVLPEAGPFLALDIIKGELIFCDDPDRQAEDELYLLRRAGDLAYYEQQRRHLILDGDSI
jgi:uncharacterized protein